MWSVLVALGGWLAGWAAFGVPRRLRALGSPSTTTPEGDPALSIVIPARNEQTSLPLLLADLARVAPAGSEIVVVDDESEDRTAQVARAVPGVKVVAAGERPAGWAGKPWACHVGAREAGAATLCFVDADVRLGSGALEALLARLRTEGGLVSVQPFHRTEEPWEQGSALFGVVALMGAGTGHRQRDPLAFGPVLVCERSDYELAGGHEAVCSEVVEDVALARHFTERGLPVTVLTGGDLVGFRMYPDGPRSMFEGWTKSFATGAASTTAWRLALVVGWLAAMGTAFGLGWDAVLEGESTAVGLGAFGLFVVQLRIMFTRVGTFGWLTALAFPVLLACFFVVFFWSLWCTAVRHEVRWRGRTLPTGARSEALE